MTICGITSSEFLDCELARGIVTTKTTALLASRKDIKNQSIWIPMVAGSFLKAILENTNS